MNSILAQIKKDFYLNRYIILACFAYQAYGVILQWDIIGLFNSQGIGDKALFFYGPKGGMFLILVAALIFHTDPDTHTDAFCLTRPLSPRKRTIAKFILISGVIFGPMAFINLIYTIRYGGSFYTLASRDIATFFLIFIGIGAASLSRSIPRLIIIFIGISICLMLTAQILIRPLFTSLPWGDSPFQSIYANWSLVIGDKVMHLMLGAIFAVVAFLPLKMRMRSLQVALVAALLGSFVHEFAYHPSFNIIKPHQTQTAPTQFQVVQKAFFEPDVYVGRQGPNARELKSLIKFELEGIRSDTGTDVFPQLLTGQLETEGRTLHPSYDALLYKLIDRAFSFSPNSFENALEGLQLLNKDQFESKESIDFTAIDISNEVLDELRGKKATFKGRLGLITAKYSKVATVPLDPGSTFKAEYYFGKIDAFDMQSKQLNIKATIGTVIDHFDRASPVWTRLPDWTAWEHQGREFLLLYNSKTNEAIIPETLRTRSDYVTRFRKIWNAGVSQYELSFKLDDSITAEWLENAEILVVERKVVHTQDEEFIVENITL